MNEAMTVRFWGVRGSYPVPGSQTLFYGGNTACIEIQAGPHTLMFDAGSGAIPFGSALVERAKDAQASSIMLTVFFSHLHADHTIGFPFFQPAHRPDAILHLLGPRIFAHQLDQTLAAAMLPPASTVTLEELPSTKIVRTVSEHDQIIIGPGRDTVQIVSPHAPPPRIDLDQVHVAIHHSHAHPKTGVHCYRITWRGRVVVLATDTEGYVATDRRLVQFASGADLLIHDAQYQEADYMNPAAPRQGYGHSTPRMACAVAQASGVHQLVLFHHDPMHDDETIAAMEAEAQSMFPATTAAYEGLAITLEPR